MKAAVLALVIGALPGLALVLLAQFVIKGEWQLTVGVWGILLACVGAVIGVVLDVARRR